MRSSKTFVFALALFSLRALSFAQTSPSAPSPAAPASPAVATSPTAVKPPASAAAPGSLLTLRAASSINVASELGGAFSNPAKCDGDGNLYIKKYAMDRNMMGTVVKIDADGKKTASFDPTVFSQLELGRADAFSPAPDGGLYEIAQTAGVKPTIYVLHFGSDGSALSPARLDADFEVYTFAAFANGNFLVSGVKRDPQNRQDHGTNITEIFAADGRELAQVVIPSQGGKSPDKATATATAAAKADAKTATEKPVTAPGQDPGAPPGDRGGKQVPSDTGSSDAPPRPTPPSNTSAPAVKAARPLDLAQAEVGSDGNLYVLQHSAPAVVYVISPSGEIIKKLKISATAHGGGAASGFHVSGNQLAISFWNEDSPTQMIVVADAQTGRRISSYSDGTGFGTTFACYSANENVFTFLKLGKENELTVIRAEAQ